MQSRLQRNPALSPGVNLRLSQNHPKALQLVEKQPYNSGTNWPKSECFVQIKLPLVLISFFTILILCACLQVVAACLPSMETVRRMTPGQIAGTW